MCGLEPVILLSASAIDPGPNLAALLAFFACLSGIYMLGQGLRAWRRRKTSSTTSTKIVDARSGFREIQGIAEGPHTMSAAVSGKDCYFYRTTIWREDPNKHDVWKKAAEETFCLPFFLADGTGRILLDPRGAAIDLPRDVYEEYGKTLLSTHTDIPERLENFLARHEIAMKSAIRVEEYLIASSASIFASGMIVANKDGFDLTPTPLNRVDGGYSPMLHSATLAVAAKTSPIRETHIAAEAQGSEPTLSRNGEYSINGTNSTTIATTEQPAMVQPEVIRLSLPSLEVGANMTMQSRLAAALRRANAESTETWGMALPEVHATGTTVKEQAVSEPQLVETPALPPVEQFTPKPPREPAPALVFCKGTNGSVLTLSWQSHSAAGGSSAFAVVLLITGPVLTLVAAYYLLLNFGWL